MFSALSTVIIQGPLNTDSSSFLVISYSLACSLSFASLFITIVICIEIVMRASKFMYRKSKSDTKNLREAIQFTRDIIKAIRHKEFDDQSTPAGPVYSSKRTNPAMTPFTPLASSVRTNRTDETIVKFADMPNDDILAHWEKHEKVVHGFLQKRERIIDKQLPDIGSTTRRDQTENLMTFDSYWELKCRFWSDLATLTFYIGTLSLLVACMIFMWSEYDLTYSSKEAAILAVIIIGVSLIVGIALGVSLRFYQGNGKTSISRTPSAMPRSRYDDDGVYVQMHGEDQRTV
jgi:hypothetical protein